MRKYAIVTFLFNDYDFLREPSVVDENFDYFCLTDDEALKSEVWNCIYINELDTSDLSGRQKVNIAKNSFYKYLPKSYDWWICIDASVKVIGELSELINYFIGNNYNIGLSIHANTMRYLDEYRIWEITRGLDAKYTKIFKEYAAENDINLKEHSGLIECTVKVYKNDELVISFIDEIYETLKERCNFEDLNDQCYITVIFSKYDDKLNTCFFYRQLYYESKYFEKYDHKNDVKQYNFFNEKTNNKNLLGKIRELKTF